MSVGRSHEDLNLLRPEDITSENVPVAMRGYEKHEVDRRLAWAREAYSRVLQQRDSLREQLDTVDDRVKSAEGEAQVSAKELADQAQRAATAEDELAQARERLTTVENELRRADAERKLALDDMRGAKEEAVRLQSRVDALENALRNRSETTQREPEPATPALGADGDAAALLLAATRTAEELRLVAREQAHKAIKKAREHADALTAQAEEERQAAAAARERAAELAARVDEARRAADEALEHRRAAEREANEILSQARSEAQKTLGSLDEERQRVRRLLTDALDSLESGQGTDTGTVLTDLSSRLRAAD